MKKNNLSISLIIPHYHNMFSSYYTLEIIKEVSKSSLDFNVDLLIETAWKASPGSGILFADVMNNEEWIKRAKKQKIPYILLNYYDSDSKDNCIGIDNEKASREAVTYLISAGHSRIATITGKLNAQAGISRLSGYRRALATNKIEFNKKYIIIGDWTRESGRRAIKKLLSLKEVPTAVFASGDEMAIGAMEAAKEAGLKIPQDISFVGFDNIPQAELPENSLTTIEQPFPDLAMFGVKYLIQAVKNKSKQPIKILLDNTRLIKRASVKDLSK